MSPAFGGVGGLLDPVGTTGGPGGAVGGGAGGSPDGARGGAGAGTEGDGGGSGLRVPGRSTRRQRGWARGGRQDSGRRRGKRRSRLAVGLVLVVLLPFLMFALVLVTVAGSRQPDLPIGFEPSPEAVADIPADFMALYQEAAVAEGIDWAILAGIGKLECDHGRSQLAGCSPPGTVNQAGARGPMQFLGSTWRASAGQYDLEVAGPPVPRGQEHLGYATDANGDGVADPWDAADAVHAAARYLVASGAPGDYDSAVFAYNRSRAYVSEVLRWAETYRGAAQAAAASASAEASVAQDGSIELATVGGITVNVAIAQPLESLLAAAARDGLNLTGGGYRSADRQIELRRQNCGTSDYAVYEMPASQCSPPTARPGTSMHEQGLAVDFENCSTRSTSCYQWLNTNAATYGFYNLPSEPWHWSIDGT